MLTIHTVMRNVFVPVPNLKDLTAKRRRVHSAVTSSVGWFDTVNLKEAI